MERYYQPEIETASREQIRAWQDERLVKQVKHVWDNVPYYRKKMEEKGRDPRRHPVGGRPAQAALCHQGRPAGGLSLRPGGQAPEGLRAHPVHLRHHRQAGGGLLHPARHRPVGGLLRPGHCGRRRHQRGRVPGVLRLRPVHRRPRPQRRQPQGGLPHHPHLLGQHRAADHVHPGPERHHPVLHPLLRRLHRRDHEGDGPDPRPDPPEGGHLRGRGLERGDAPGHPEHPGHQGLRHLRPDGAVRPRRGLRVLRPDGHAHQRGPLHRRDHRPRHRRGAARGQQGRAGVHLHHQGGLPPAALPHPGHLRAHPGEVLLRPHPCEDEQAHGPHRRHAHHPGRQRVPLPDRDRAAQPRLSRQLSDHRGPGELHRHPGRAGGDDPRDVHRQPGRDRAAARRNWWTACGPCWVWPPRSPWWPPSPSSAARARRCASSTSARFEKGGREA